MSLRLFAGVGWHGQHGRAQPRKSSAGEIRAPIPTPICTHDKSQNCKFGHRRRYCWRLKPTAPVTGYSCAEIQGGIMTIVKTEIPAEKRELNDELTPDELEAVSGG